MNSRIYIPDDRLAPAVLQFVRKSALVACTTGHGADDDSETDVRGNGTIAITTNLPVTVLSRGEQIAWRLLRSLAEGELRNALENLDGDNVGALVDCLVILRSEVPV